MVKLTPQEDFFFSLTSLPPPARISRIFDPPSPARISRIPSVGGGRGGVRNFFWNNPFLIWHEKMNLHFGKFTNWTLLKVWGTLQTLSTEMLVSRKLMFPQHFELLPNLHLCLYNLTEMHKMFPFSFEMTFALLFCRYTMHKVNYLVECPGKPNKITLWHRHF